MSTSGSPSSQVTSGTLPSSTTMSVRDEVPASPRLGARNKKERQKLVKSFYVFGRKERDYKKIKVLMSYSPPKTSNEETTSRPSAAEDDIDESSIALLCLPDGIQTSSHEVPPHFHSILITKQNGSRVYGSVLIVWEEELQKDMNRSAEDAENKNNSSSSSKILYGAEKNGTSLVLVDEDELEEDGDERDEAKERKRSRSDEEMNNKVTNQKVYVTKALCFLTSAPFTVATRSLLQFIYDNKCDSDLVKYICNIKLPSKGKFLKIKLPTKWKGHPCRSFFNGKSVTTNECDGLDSEVELTLSTNSHGPAAEVFIYRGMLELPLFDYPLRELFTNVLSPEQFLLAFTAVMLEFQVLVFSKDYYYLMLVSEALTHLLLPFKWQHVYVPILPSKLGLHYLDAPTPYIMGINPYKSQQQQSSTSNSSSSSSAPFSFGSFGSCTTHSIQCRIDCDNNRVECINDEEIMDQMDLNYLYPPFILELKNEIESILSSDVRITTQGTPVVARNQSEAMKRVTEIARKHKVVNDEFSYLDDLKLNQSLRIVFMRTLRKYILTDYERFIFNAQSRRDTIKFDVVSYLCDQPDSMRPFLTKFLETQMFVTFIDETAKKIQKSKQHMYSSHQSLLSSTTTVSTEDPDDLAVFNDLLLETRFNSAQEVDLNDFSIHANWQQLNQSYDLRVIASPLKQRNLRSKSNLFKRDVSQAKEQYLAKTSSDSPSCGTVAQQSQAHLLASPVRIPAALVSQTNWRVVESLSKEVEVKTKRIVREKMGKEEIAPLGIKINNVKKRLMLFNMTFRIIFRRGLCWRCRGKYVNCFFK